MHYRRFVLFVVAFLTISLVGLAQDVISVDKLTLDQHVERRYGPIYPPIAQAAHVMGTVVIEVRVGLTGKVESMKVVSGPPMLQQAAIDCLKQWTFHPFEKDGNPTPASGIVSIEFSLGKDGPTPKEEEIANKYFKRRLSANKQLIPLVSLHRMFVSLRSDQRLSRRPGLLCITAI
jgi:TonB family protein